MHKRTLSFSHNNIFLFSVFCFAAEICLFWPGLLKDDSAVQLQQAVMGSFTDHHPPLMAFYWSVLNKMYPGPGLMLVTHLLLFWGAIYYFCRSLKDSVSQVACGLLAIISPLLIFHPFILKDIGFANCYLFVMSVLTYLTVTQQKMSPRMAFMLTVILFYGTAVKFQAMFILPLLTLWMGLTLALTYKRGLLVGLGLFASLYASISFFNAHVSTPSNSWQWVKLYDLAGISIRKNQNYFPSFVTDYPGFSTERLHQFYNPRRVDDYVYRPDPVLIKGATPQQAKEVWHYWFETVLRHPVAYLHHRGAVCWEQICLSSIKSPQEIKGKEIMSPSLLRVSTLLDHYNLIPFAKLFTSFAPYLPFQILYLCLGLYYRRSPLGRTLLFLNGIGLGLLATLFFFSMAAEARYLYLSLGCVHFSHPFAYALWRSRKTARRPGLMDTFAPLVKVSATQYIERA